MDSWYEAFAKANFRHSAETAHDLKTPLNVAVLNLELLRMRVRKLADGNEDERIAEYAKSIEAELRRMARIFDSFFILSVPPAPEQALVPVDLGAACRQAASGAGYDLVIDGTAILHGHEERLQLLFKLVFEGAERLLAQEDREMSCGVTDGSFQLNIGGKSIHGEFDISRVFKFYHSDPQGNPDLALASARLIAETYGGGLNAEEEHDKVSLRLSLPPGGS